MHQQTALSESAAAATTSWQSASYRRVLVALRLFMLTHLLALPLLAVWLAPGLDAGVPLLERARYVAEHALSWRLGWLSWQLCALSDVVLTATLLSWARARGGAAWGWAIAAVIGNLLAVVPEQWAELVLVTRYADEARTALGEPLALVRFGATERWALIMTAVCGNGGYIATTIAWQRSLSSAGRSPRRWFSALTWLSCGLFALSSLALLAGLHGGINHTPLVAITSGPAFVLLIVWALLAAHTLGESSGLPPAQDGSLHQARWPDGHPLRFLATIANSRGLRDLVRIIPMVRMKSDISDVVYLNWLVPSAQAQQLLPAPLRVHDLNGVTALSILSYRHHHFGPALLGPLRRLFPSPNQSNWRLYLDNPDATPRDRRDAIYFIKTTISSLPLALASRLLADGLPAQLAPAFVHERHGTRIETHLDAQGGNAAELHAIVVEHDQPVLPASWRAHFDDWRAAVNYLVDQNRAVAVDRPRSSVFESAIVIPIALDSVKPASVEQLEVGLIDNLIAAAEPFAFVVPQVAFEARGERTIAPL